MTKNQLQQETFTESYLGQSIHLLHRLMDRQAQFIDQVAYCLKSVRDANGRLFIIGVGGSAGTASHAVNDFRKICRLESYTPTDNVSELTARVNDDGWDTSYANWLIGSHLSAHDAVLVLSVGGGNRTKNVSMNIVKALELAQSVDATIVGIVGKDGGFTAEVADACVIIPPTFSNHITPHTEGIASIILHLLVSHPDLKVDETKWESLK
jgi:D-sedoheptulose 7-phosphate isomerase